MKPVQTFDNFPSFANAGSRQAPGDAKYSLGFVAADTLPAEWANYFFHGATKGVSDLNSATYSIWNEMNSVLAANNITPDASDSDQLLEALQKMMRETALAAHPVGSLYWTSSTENPAVTFGGGTWVEIKDRFILACGDTYANGATGGEVTVTLTADQMPSHNHGGYTGSDGVDHSHSFSGTTGDDSPDHTHNYAVTITSITGGFGAIGSGVDNAVTTTGGANQRHQHTFSGVTATATAYLHTHSIGAQGGDQPHNNMPPYIVKYCWERTA